MQFDHNQMNKFFLKYGSFSNNDHIKFLGTKLKQTRKFAERIALTDLIV